eukprot:ANDGO_03940.mRNA.1 Uncharacterized protein HI_0912
MSGGEVRVRQVGVKEGYDLWSKTYDTTANPVVAYDELVLRSYMESPAGLCILDAGCGTGRHLPFLVDGGAQRVVAVDFSAGMLETARCKLSLNPRVQIVEFVQGDVCSLPPVCRDGLFDFVVCSLVGEHIESLRSMFREFHRSLKPRGTLLFSVYHPFMALSGVEANFRTSAEEDGLQDTEYRLGAFRHLVSHYFRAMQEAGFQISVFDELCGTQQLAERLPKASKYLNKPLLLILKGTKMIT